MNDILFKIMNHLIDQLEHAKTTNDIEYLNSRIFLFLDLIIEDI